MRLTNLPDTREVIPRYRELAAQARGLGDAPDALVSPALAEQLVRAGAETVAYALGLSPEWVSAIDDRRERSGAAMTLGRVLFRTRRWEELSRAATELAPHVNAEVAARLRILEAWTCVYTDRQERADALVKAVESASVTTNSFALAADLAHYRGYRSAFGEGDARQAQHCVDLAVSLYRDQGDRFGLLPSLVLASSLRITACEFPAAAALTREALSLACDDGNVGATMRGLTQLAISYYRRGELTRALTCIENARALSEDAQDHVLEANLPLAEARVRLMLEDHAAAVEALGRAEQILAKNPDPRCTAVLLEYQGMARLASGDADGARVLFTQAQAAAGDSSVRSYEKAERLLRQAEAFLASDDSREAMRLAARGLSVLEDCGDTLDRGQLYHVAAISAHRLGDDSGALQLLGEAEDQVRGTGERFELARVLLTRAESFAANPEEAAAAAAEALNLFQRMGVAAAERRARHVLASVRAGRKLPPSSGKGGAATVDGNIVALSPPMVELLKEVQHIAAHPGSVLITGETGVGKEVIAQLIHRQSDRRDRPFVPVNCAAIPESLFERELFGHVRGAFTDADSDGPGLAEYASGGTLFLDEIGELAMPMQAKLLRLLQEGTYRRVGDVRQRRTDLRVVAASNRDLHEGVQEKQFRLDLLYRLCVFELEIPPLFRRPEDILPLTRLFLQRQREILGRDIEIEDEVIDHFLSYRWPGNVRELEAAVASSAARANGRGRIRVGCLPRAIRAGLTHAEPVMDLAERLAQEERRIIEDVLRRTRNKVEAARQLGISRNTLYEKIRKLGLSAA